VAGLPLGAAARVDSVARHHLRTLSGHLQRTLEAVYQEVSVSDGTVGPVDHHCGGRVVCSDLKCWKPFRTGVLGVVGGSHAQRAGLKTFERKLGRSLWKQDDLADLARLQRRGASPQNFVADIGAHRLEDRWVGAHEYLGQTDVRALGCTCVGRTPQLCVGFASTTRVPTSTTSEDRVGLRHFLAHLCDVSASDLLHFRGPLWRRLHFRGLLPVPLFAHRHVGH